MEKFEAKNGLQIEADLGPVVRIWEGSSRDKENNRLRGFSYLNDRDVEALREFFQHERDQELGRWRWPENPDMVVQADKGGERAWVVDERNQQITGWVWRVDLDCSSAHTQVVAAARAYFDARPGSKPWHDAQPGDVWVLTVAGKEHPWGFDPIDQRFVYAGGESWLRRNDEMITAGRRIWPEVSE